MRILLMETNRELAQAISDLFHDTKQWKLVALAKDIEELPDLLAEHHPDLLLLSYILARRNFKQLLRQILACRTETKVLVLSLFNDSRLALRALASGAAGYLLKERIAEELPIALQVIESGGIYLSPGIAGAEASTEPLLRSAGGEGGNRGILQTGENNNHVLLWMQDKRGAGLLRCTLEELDYQVHIPLTGMEATQYVLWLPPAVFIADEVLLESADEILLNSLRAQSGSMAIVVIATEGHGPDTAQPLPFTPFRILENPISIPLLLETTQRGVAAPP